MFNSIRGELSYKGVDSVFVLNNGIEWDIGVSAQAIKQMPGVGKTIRLFVHLYHREDRMKLYGFISESERALFHELCSVEKIGPSLAIKILSGLAPENFIKALDSGDIVTLTGIPGLGKKTAERIIFKLKGKILQADSDSQDQDELLKALEAMGFERKNAKAALLWAKKEVTDKNLTQEQIEQKWLQKALYFLSQKNNPS